MAVRKSSKNAVPTVRPRGFTGGARHALAMLRRLERSQALCGACCPEPEYRPGKQQRNIVLEFLTPMLLKGDMDAVAGFCSVLTGLVSTVAEGTVPSSGYLAHYVEQHAKADTARNDERFARFMDAVVV